MPRPRKILLPVPEGNLTAEEAMKRLDVSLATFYKYKREFKDFPTPARINGRDYYRVEEIDAFKLRHS